MATEVIMPALGMAQETGKLLTWLKAAGEAVQTGDVLFEVETDKSVSEVEAQSDGFLTDVTANPGDDVPVGQRIAMISETADDTAPIPTAAATDNKPAVPEPLPVAAETPKTHLPVAPPALNTGRVLASPKARRLASEEGLDLFDLQKMGHPQPYHVSDLTILRNLPTNAPTADIPKIASHQITAHVPNEALAAFLTRMSCEGGIALPASAVLCNFAAAAWRMVSDESEFVVGLTAIGQPDRHLIEPDRFRLSAQPKDTEKTPPAIILRDLTGSAITAMQIGAPNVPLMNIASDGAIYTLTFTFTPDQMADDAAIAFVTDFAARVADPLPYLV